MVVFYVDERVECPECGAVVEDWECLDGECLPGMNDYRLVHRFYSTCGNCGTWIGFTRKPAESLADFEAKVQKSRGG